MTENEETERLSARNPTVQISELPGKPYGITMEVPLFLSMLSISLSGAALSNIIMYRTCVHTLGHDINECKLFLSPHRKNETNHLEEEVQKYTTFVQTVKIVLESVGPAILSFFLGAWSDTHGRKPLVVWPLFGLSLQSIMIVVYSMVDSWGPWWYILTAVPYSLTGGYAVLFTGAFCYISDISTTQKRSLRMTVLEASVSLGSVLGAVASSYLLRAVGNIYLLLIASVCSVTAYAFTNVYLRESLTGAIKGGLMSVLDLLLIKEMMRECFKRRSNHGRAQILLLTAANCLSIFILYGLISLEYMYSREKLHWSMRDYTIYSAVNTTIAFVASFLGVVVLQRLFGMSDLVFAIIAFVSSAAEYIIKALAVDSWHMYLGAGVSAFKGLSAPLIRSFMTKILPIEDIAKVFSLMCALEGICPLFAPPIFNTLYAYTISSFPAAIYVLSTGIVSSCVVMLGFVQYYRCKPTSSSQYRPLDNQSI